MGRFSLYVGSVAVGYFIVRFSAQSSWDLGMWNFMYTCIVGVGFLMWYIWWDNKKFQMVVCRQFGNEYVIELESKQQFDNFNIYSYLYKLARRDVMELQGILERGISYNKNIPLVFKYRYKSHEKRVSVRITEIDKILELSVSV